MGGNASVPKPPYGRGSLLHIVKGTCLFTLIPFHNSIYELYFVQVNNDGVFQAAFVIHLAAVEVIKAYGRPVCSTDMGHFKHDLFDGLNCTGTLVLILDFLLSTCTNIT